MKFAPTYQLASYLLSVMIIGVAFCMSPVYAQTDSLQLSPQLKIDSSHIEVRTFDPEMIEAYRSQNAFDYSKTVPDLNWIERILKSIIGFLEKSSKATNIIVKIIIYLGLGIALIIFILNIIKLKPSYIFRKNSKDLGLDFEELEENLSEMDFDQLIADAEKQNAFKTAIRLRYLEALKILSHEELIQWRKDKTNRDYQDELISSPVKEAFEALSQSFEYAWYGDFNINEEAYKKIVERSREIQQQIQLVS